VPFFCPPTTNEKHHFFNQPKAAVAAGYTNGVLSDSDPKVKKQKHKTKKIK